MLELMNQMDTRENTVKVDLLYLDPTAPDGGCCCGRHKRGQERKEGWTGLYN